MQTAPPTPAATREVDGVVVDGEGRAIAGARVAAREAGVAPVARPAATTREDGRFRIPLHAAGLQYQLMVQADGYAPEWTSMGEATSPGGTPMVGPSSSGH
jgi:hypothetical protein